MTDIMQSKVSILIPVYNREHFISECIDSALAQTYSNIEVVVVDNQSTDGTWSICQQYAEKDVRVRIFQNAENIGPVKNWQRCFDEARGVFAKILFSDDWLHPDFLANSVRFLLDSRVGFVFADVEIAPAPSQYSGVRGATATFIQGKRYIDMNFFEYYKVPLSPCAALFRLSDLRGNLRWDIPSPVGTDFAAHGAGPDLLLYLLVASQYPLVVKIESKLVLFRKHLGSITVSLNKSIIATYYAQARIWFASRFCSTKTYHRLLAFEWLQYCWRVRKVVSFSSYIQSVFNDKPVISLSVVVWSVFKLLSVKVSHLLLRIADK